MALLSLVSQLVGGRIARPENARRWPGRRSCRRRCSAGSARVIELSYGGVKLEMRGRRATGGPRSDQPTFGVSVQAVACWSQLAEEGGSWRCGAEVAPIDSDATRTWRWIVDSLN